MGRLPTSGRSRRSAGLSDIVMTMRERRKTRTATGGRAALAAAVEVALVPSPEASPDRADVVSSLNDRKKATLARLDQLAAQAREEADALASIDAVLKLFDPGHVSSLGAWWAAGAAARAADATEDTDGKRPAADARADADAFCGDDDRTEVVMSMLRAAGRPMTSSELVGEWSRRKSAELPADAREIMISRVSGILARLRRQSKVRSADDGPHRKLWCAV